MAVDGLLGFACIPWLCFAFAEETRRREVRGLVAGIELRCPDVSFQSPKIRIPAQVQKKTRGDRRKAMRRGGTEGWRL